MYEDTESWAKWMVVELSLEQQLMIEAGTRELKKQDPDEELVEVAVSLLQQNAIQSQLIKQCVEKISELEAKMLCKPRPKNKVFQFFFRKEAP